MKTLIESISGSRMYGTEREDSDTDIRSVCLEPIDAVIGLGQFEQEVLTDPDKTTWGIKQFIKLALSNNPNILDVYFTPEKFWIESTPEWRMLYDMRDAILSKRVQKTFAGYANGKIMSLENNRSHRKDLIEKFGYDVKDGSHLMRLIIKAREILENGTYNPVLTGNELAMCRAILNGKLGLQELIDQARIELDMLKQMKTFLPDEPNKRLFECTLMDLYHNYIKDYYNAAKAKDKPRK